MAFPTNPPLQNNSDLVLKQCLEALYDQYALGNGMATEATLLAFKAANAASLQAVADQVNRPSAKTGRTHVSIVGTTTVAGLLYTVTPGKKLYITSIFIPYQLAASSAASYLTLRDGGAGGTMKHISPTFQTVAAATGINTGSLAIVEPMQFSTDITLVFDAGTYVRANYLLIGYEE